MRVLVTAASKHGATAEIADRIAEVLGRRGLDVAVAPPDRVEDPRDFDALVVGSAVYAGHWLAPARDLVERIGGTLGAMPVWLFSSGPIGDPPKPDEEPIDVADGMEALGARGHVLFAGRLDKSLLGFGERAIVTALRAPEGDFRDWTAIEAWAGSIATELGYG